MNDQALARIERTHARPEQLAVVDDVVPELLVLEHVDQLELPGLVAVERAGQRPRCIRAPGLDRLDDLLLLHADRRRDLRDRRRAPERRGERLELARYPVVQLL